MLHLFEHGSSHFAAHGDLEKDTLADEMRGVYLWRDSGTVSFSMGNATVEDMGFHSGIIA